MRSKTDGGRILDSRTSALRSYLAKLATPADGPLKTCSKCKLKKGLWDFSKNKSMADGLHHYCKDCLNAYNQAVRATFITNVQWEGDKTCTKCKVTKPVDEFGYHRSKKTGRRSCCLECERESRRVYVNRMLSSNPELFRERMRENWQDWYYKNEGWLISMPTRQQRNGYC
jgi:hypothetical protein